ncbi:hypothetical protein D9M68_361280 [compost metagenome]|uniref:Uncharacterized protein n=1 Tax=Pseudomonas jinjuensis TaxID=198616 RepID=A0A1H0JRX6_9PSED|nr:hypothetical protein [Pseudomonas jinjuensis]SDO46498.1 hypothetical protein SAMN05216193_111183 [Pseudomonas jinjuensis]
MNAKANFTRNELASIADHSIDFMRYGQQHTRWLAALMAAIDDTLQRGPAILEARVSRARDLASLGQYLADDCSNYLDCEAERVQSALDEEEVKIGGLSKVVAEPGGEA